MRLTKRSRYKRILLKISGEALMGDLKVGLHPPTVNKIASQIKKVHEKGIEVCLVIGGGNIFRGLQGSAQGMERTTADYMGMLATVMNSLAMQSELEKLNVHTRVISAIPMDQICEPYIRRRAVRHFSLAIRSVWVVVRKRWRKESLFGVGSVTDLSRICHGSA